MYIDITMSVPEEYADAARESALAAVAVLIRQDLEREALATAQAGIADAVQAVVDANTPAME